MTHQVGELLSSIKSVELLFLFRYFFAVIITENSIDYKFGDQIDFWIGILVVCFALDTFVVYESHHLKRNTAKVGKAFCVCSLTYGNY